MSLQWIKFILNNEPRNVLTDPERTLLDLIRKDFSLTGTKKSCNKGVCGACTVLIDGRPVNSCVYPVKNVNGREVITIEGLGTPKNLHPIQKAFITVGAAQCGYCTPGMILNAKAILDKQLNPTREDVRKAINRNLCRCTGYQKIIDGILLAAEFIRNPEAMEKSSHETRKHFYLGNRVPQLNSVQKVTGTLEFPIDVNVYGICHAKVLHSPYFHAKILAIDTAEAEALDGVITVCTHKDLKENKCSMNMRVLADDRVRFWGEPVAIVVALNEKIAENALSKIKVEYEELPHYKTPYEAMKEDAIEIQPDEFPGNIVYAQNLLKGEVEKGFKEADVVVESKYTTPANAHAYLEPSTGIGWIDDEGRICIYCPGQSPHSHQRDVAWVLGLNENQVRLVEATTGGGFGARLAPFIQLLTGLAVYKARHPVRLELSMEEDFVVYPKRHPFNIKMKTGARKDGKIVAQQAEVVTDAGAYALASPLVLVKSIIHSCGPYEIPNVKVCGRSVLTNNTPSSAMRGFGVPQIAFATEMQMNKIARLLEMDPLELRKINCLKKGSVTETGQEITEPPGYLETIETIKNHWIKCKKYTNPETIRLLPPHIKRGVGFASAKSGIGKEATLNYARAIVEVIQGGKIRIREGASDLGQGANTVVAILAAEELKIPLESIEVISADSLETPDCDKTCASKQTFYTGNATLGALQKLKIKAYNAASKELGISEDDLDCAEGLVFAKDDTSRRISFEELVEKGYELKAENEFKTNLKPLDRETGQGDVYVASSTYGTTAVEVEVNTDTGEIKVLSVATCFQCGKAINRLGVEGQLEGGTVMGLGFALQEKYNTGETRGFRDYRIPRSKEVPDIYTYIVEVPQKLGPYDAIGLGEASVVPVAPAIISAVYDVCGIWIDQLPATPEKVLTALKKV